MPLVAMQTLSHIEETRMATGEFPYQPLWTPLPPLVTQREDFSQAMNDVTAEIHLPFNSDKNVDSEHREYFGLSQLGFYLSFRWSNHLNTSLSNGLWGGFISLQRTRELSNRFIHMKCPQDHAWEIALLVAKDVVASPSRLDRFIFDIEQLVSLFTHQERYDDSALLVLFAQHQESLEAASCRRVGRQVKRRFGEQSLEYECFLGVVAHQEKKQFEKLDESLITRNAITSALNLRSTNPLPIDSRHFSSGWLTFSAAGIPANTPSRQPFVFRYY